VRAERQRNSSGISQDSPARGNSTSGIASDNPSFEKQFRLLSDGCSGLVCVAMNLTRACQFPLLPHRNIAGRSSSHSRHYDPALQEQVKPPGTRLIAFRAGAFVVLLIARHRPDIPRR